MSMRYLYPIFVASLALTVLSGCGEEKKKRGFSFFPNMHDQNSVRAQESEPLPEVKGEETKHVRAMRKPVEGTIPTDFVPYTLRGKMMDFAAAKNDVNPLPMTKDVLEAGRRAYNIYCIVCHGERGMGKGSIILHGEKPGFYNSGYKSKSATPMSFPGQPIATLIENEKGQKVSLKNDGEMFNYISRGGVLMPSYGRLPTAMRWSIVHYVRVLQKAQNPSTEELAAYKKVKNQYQDIEPTAIVNKWKQSTPKESETAGHDAHSKSH